jgi:hypothetical protein
VPPHWTSRRAHNGSRSIDFQRIPYVYVLSASLTADDLVAWDGWCRSTRWSRAMQMSELSLTHRSAAQTSANQHSGKPCRISPHKSAWRR